MRAMYIGLLSVNDHRGTLRLVGERELQTQARDAT